MGSYYRLEDRYSGGKTWEKEKLKDIILLMLKGSFIFEKLLYLGGRMSRSIHTTKQKIILEQKYQYSDNAEKEAQLNKIKDEIDSKRIIKKRKSQERKTKDKNVLQLEPSDPQGIPINVIEANEYIHYPTSKKDLIEVAKRLPVNALAGIKSITFCLGKEYQEEEYDGFGEKSYDPYTGRMCSGDGPIYYPPILGVYRLSNNKVFIFAYVYDKKNLEIDIIKPFLRLKMMITFIHEIAHHDDNIRRNGRGHYLELSTDKCEYYAELQEVRWAYDAVIPYLEAAYSEEYTLLFNWIKSKTGVEVTLKSLINENPERIGNLYRLGFTLGSAVDEMIKNASGCKSDRDIILEFANDLHIGDYYGECMTALETLLLKYPDDADALGLKADTLIHLDKYDEAESTAMQCLRIDPNNIDALFVLCDIYLERKNWTLVKEHSSKGVKVSTGWQNARFLERSLIAALHLKEYKTAYECSSSLPDKKGGLEQKKFALTALVVFASGDNIQQSIQISRELLAEEKVIMPAKAISKAILIKCGDNIDNFKVTENEKNYLQMMGIMELVKI